MTNIEKVSKIRRDSLSGEHYFQSLLEQAYMEQVLSDTELEKIQFDCLALLAKKTERYNSGDSSSVRIEKAQDILDSIMFTIGVQLKTYQIPDDAITALQREGLETICREGRKRIDQLIKHAKMSQAALLSRLLQTENVFYAATIVDGIKGFFKLYYPEFMAQEIHITADYPVYNKTEKLLGIEFIQQYLEQLYYENLFCANFSEDDIHHLLCGYDEHYQSLLFNLYEPVLSASLGCVLAGADIRKLEITPTVQSFLYRRFAGKERAEIEQALSVALSDLCGIFSFSEALQEYVKKSLPLLAASIESSAAMGTVDRVFIAQRFPEDNPKLIVSYGEKMDDELYRKVLDEFMRCQHMTDKIDIIKEQILSLADLNDLLLDAELNTDEIVAILKELTPAEIAVLMKKYIVQYEMNFTELRDSEKVLCESLRKFTTSLSPDQQGMLEKAVQFMEVN